MFIGKPDPDFLLLVSLTLFLYLEPFPSYSRFFVDNNTSHATGMSDDVTC
jgi:hypothetical protein